MAYERSFVMKSEKVTINLSTVELAQIDFLVERGLYASRSDFIRLATRKQTEEHKKEIEQFVDPTEVDFGFEEKDFKVWALGIIGFGQAEVERVYQDGGIIDLRVIGLLKIAKNVDPEQFRKVLKRAHISGKIVAEPEIKAIIDALNDE